MDMNAVSELSEELNHKYGIYYGWAWFAGKESTPYPMVMSFGINPHYGNKQASAVS